MNFEVKRVTHGPKHHLFGFHDLVQTNAKEDVALSLEVEDISRPPLPGETCGNGVVDLATGEFREISRTHTWNYPMGARQQWIGDTDLFTCNDRDTDGRLCSVICDARKGEVVERLPFPIHCLDEKFSNAFYVNYDRLYRLGAYGYCGGHDEFASDDIPAGDGIWVGDMKVGRRELLVSIKDVASCGEARPVDTGFPHYVTHLTLNPSRTRIAFLHEYRVRDGGDISRLMTIGVDGRGLRCLAKGLASHFDWVDDEHIFFWGYHRPDRAAIRESAKLANPCYRLAFRAAKQIYRVVRYIRMVGKTQSRISKGCDIHGVLLGTDREWDDKPFLRNVKPDQAEDIHPMSNPVYRDWLVHDTYPDDAGYRMLCLYDYKKGVSVELARLKRMMAEPDSKANWVAKTLEGVDKRILKHFALKNYLFTRSGYHCDFHPRWGAGGKTVFFDSTHEGSRQIYSCDVGGVVC